ncbi:MAG: HAD family hydrolase [Pseudomonadota bacterium]|nr:HAD family hydrolase [Pseudomonadota bacterium]
MKKKAVFFDRDDTLIVDKVYLNDPQQIEYLSDTFLALKRLSDAGYLLFIISNQSGIARGLVDPKNLELIHKKMTDDFMQHGIKFAGIYFCPHLPESNHPDRKPNPGMILRAEKDHPIELTQSWVVGDRTTDIEAGLRVGLKTILLQALPSRHNDPGPQPNFTAKSLTEVAGIILGESK